MRCAYLSDLHLESEDYQPALRGGDVLVIAGDLCHARCLDPARVDRYATAQRARVLRFLEAARGRFGRIVLVAGNHEHYDGVFEDTIGLLRAHLPDVAVLDNEILEIGDIRLFGATLWSDFAGRSKAAIDGVRRRMGEYFFVKTRKDGATGEKLRKFRPEDALAAHDIALAALRSAVATAAGKKTIVITHHAPSLLGGDPRCAGNGLDGAYCSDLDDEIASLAQVPVWIHGHTHIARTYRIGSTTVRTNARGFASKAGPAPGFSATAHFDI